MVLFISDIHFGRSPIEQDRLREQELIQCLRTYQDDITALYLVGDIFEQYIEYKHLVPKGFSRFQGLLAEWTDRGIPVSYIVGNHDPWHRDYFNQELGINLIFDYLQVNILNHAVFVAHGDEFDTKGVLGAWLRRFTRYSWVTTLYRMALFGDFAYAFAHWVSKNFHSDDISAKTVAALRDFATKHLTQSNDQIVVMGHAHNAELVCVPSNNKQGLYLNTGMWHSSQTFGLLTEHELALMQWKNGKATVLDQEHF
jgi:UDP-2,3-diacylglucosamine hydrolase